MKYKKEDSYFNEKESISVGNKVLYDLCKSYPMNDDVNGLIAKLWLIGRSYSASIERRHYGMEYSKSINKKTELSLNTDGNGSDSYFKGISDAMIRDNEYQNIINSINLLMNKKFYYNFDNDKETLKEICNLVFNFNLMIRRAIEKFDDEKLKEFEDFNKKSKQDRNLNDFISFSSKFLHFHLPEIVFIFDRFSFKHAKRKIDKKKKSNYVFVISKYEILFEIPQNSVKSINLSYRNEKEKDYVQHVERCYAIMCTLHEKYKCDITPRMVDNFLININVDLSKK